MNSFERVKQALEHKEPDRIPFDLGGTAVTGMHKDLYKVLREYLNLPEKDIKVNDRIQQLAGIHEDVIERLNVDIKRVGPEAPNVNRLGTKVKKEDGYYSYKDEWGITWKMPVDNGYYFDMRGHPLSNIDTIQGLKEYDWPNPLDEGRFKTMKERADKCVNKDKKGCVVGRIAAGIFELALWLRGFEKFFMDLAMNQKFAEALLDKLTEQKMKYWERALKEVGKNALVISEADDLATQEGLLISKNMYREFIKPRHKQLFDFIKEKAESKVYIFYHSCGAVRELIPDLIEEGIDILNPVQVSAQGMDTKELNDEFGSEITFWGGGVDTQRVLPYGSPDEVKEEVKRRINDLAPGGGFVFAPVHNAQRDVPPENYYAMWETLQEYGEY